MSFALPDGPQPRRLDELTSLRGILAMRVMLCHMLACCGYLRPELPQPLGRIWFLLMEGTPGVDTFIILSGFSISFLLHKRRESYGRFMAGRFWRIYPVYVVCLLFGMATNDQAAWLSGVASWRETIYFDWLRDLATSGARDPVAHAVPHLTLLNGLLPKSILPDATGTLLPPAWSLSLEWQYYLLAPLIARLVLSGTGLLAVTALAFAGMRYGHFWQNPHLAFLPAYLPLYLIGIGTYHFYARFGNSSEPRMSSIAVAALVGVAVFLQFHPFALITWAITFACILTHGGGHLDRVFAVLRRFLLKRWLLWLGKISFPLFLVHWPMIICLLFLLVRFSPGIPSHKALGLLLVVGVPVNLIAAQLLHRFVELPGMALGKKLARREPAVAGPTTAPES